MPFEIILPVLGLLQPLQAKGGKPSVRAVSAYVSELKPFAKCSQWQEASYLGPDNM